MLRASGESSTKLSSEFYDLGNVAIALKFGISAAEPGAAGASISIVKRKMVAYLLYATISVTLFRPYNTPNLGFYPSGMVLPN